VLSTTLNSSFRTPDILFRHVHYEQAKAASMGLRAWKMLDKRAKKRQKVPDKYGQTSVNHNLYSYLHCSIRLSQKAP